MKPVSLFQVAKKTCLQLRQKTLNETQKYSISSSVSRKSQFGFETLLDISGVSVQTEGRPPARLAPFRVKSDLKSEVERMKQKLKDIESKEYQSSCIQVVSDDDTNTNTLEDQFVKSLRQEITKQKLKAFKCCLRNVYLRKLIKQLQIIHNVEIWRSENKKRTVGSCFLGWKKLSSREDEKRRMKEIIKARLLEKRQR